MARKLELFSRRSVPIACLGISLVLSAACSTGRTSANPQPPASDSSGTTPEPPVSATDVAQLVAAAAQIKTVPADIHPALQRVQDDTGFAMVGPRGCEPDYKATSEDLSNCVWGDRAGTKTIVILGDSHAAMWLPGLDLLARRIHWRVIDINKVNCGTADLDNYYLYQEHRPYTECNSWRRWAIDSINKMKPELVLLTSESSTVKALSGGGTGVSTPEEWQAGLERTIKLIPSPAIRKVILGDIPYTKQDPSACLAAHLGSAQSCSSPASVAVNSQFHRAEEAAAAATNARYINVVPWFCTAVCSPIVAKILAYSDYQHISGTYARFLSGVLQGTLQSVFDSPGK